MNFEDKILKVRQFDEEILTNLKEICEILLIYKNQPMYVDEVYNGHISYINIKNNNVVLNVTYNICETDNGDSFETMTFIIPLKYFNMTKEELIKEKAKSDENKIWFGEMSAEYTSFRQNEELERRINLLESEVAKLQGHIDWLLNRVD